MVHTVHRNDIPVEPLERSRNPFPPYFTKITKALAFSFDIYPQLPYLSTVEILTTNGITIKVETQYLPQHSAPKESKFIFGYHITIENGSDFTVQLLRRHWYIHDSFGTIREVEGEGVIGQQPILQPGEHHEYVSFCDLPTDIGKMRGTFLMTRKDDGTYFDVPVPEFRMVMPAKMN